MPRLGDSINRRTATLVRVVSTAPGDNLAERLAACAENDDLPLRLRLDCVRLQAGALAGRIRLSHAAKRHLRVALERVDDHPQLDMESV